jgi:hypothetical protein
MHEALRRLDVRAPHVVFGHTHRAGPLDGDDRSEWGRLVNTGSWVVNGEIEGAARNPYWPGGAVRVDADGPPVQLRLLDDLDAAALRPPARA